MYWYLFLLSCMNWSSGNKRDSDIELLVLCNHWKSNLHRSLVSLTSIQHVVMINVHVHVQ